MGATIAKIKEGLARYPQIAYRVEDARLIVPASSPTGFDVSMEERDGEFIVGFGGWRGHYAAEAEALDWFAFGLTDLCRLRVTCRGGVPCHWAVERRGPAGWAVVDEMGLLLFPFWRERSVVYLQNEVLKAL